MGQVAGCATSSVVYTKDTFVGIVCCTKCRSSKQSIKQTRRGQYGAIGGGSGKYDDSDEEGTALYSNNLLLDDDDEEEEQIVIITNNKKESATQRAAPIQQNIDQSVFKNGRGLLDMASPARSKDNQYEFVSPKNQGTVVNQMNRMSLQMEQDRAVNDVMNEIDDHLDDSDGEDTSYLVNANSGTGESVTKSPAREQLAKSYYPEKQQYQSNEYDAYTFADNQNYNTTANNGYDNYSNQYNNGIAEQDYQNYAQTTTNEYNNNQYNAASNNYYDQSNQGAWDQQWQSNEKQQTAEDLMNELDEAAGSDNEGLM